MSYIICERPPLIVMPVSVSVAYLGPLVKSGSLPKKTCFKIILRSSDLPLKLHGVTVENRMWFVFLDKKFILPAGSYGKTGL